MSSSEGGAPRFTRAAVISTGSEILQGLYADTNARYLAEQLSSIGIEVVLTAAAPDDEARLEKLLHFAAQEADIIICSGGLGPTEDDVNREVFARVFGVRLVQDHAAVAMMERRFKSRGREMPVSNSIQALVPESATVFQNEWGTAPGYFLPAGADKNDGGVGNGTSLIALPGPPRELIPMFEQCVLPVLKQHAAGAAFVRTTTIHTFGRPESDLNECTRSLFRRDDDVVFTILAKTYGVDFRVTAHGSSEAVVAARIDKYRALVTQCVGEADVYGFDDETLADAVAAKLTEAGETVTCAESCTGGLLAKMLTDISGSSAYFKQGLVTYANEAKQRLVAVTRETLANHGAVSAKTAREMAAGALNSANADYALAITGIAGPTGGSADKPVGLTYIALAAGDRDVKVQEHRFLGDRDQVRLTAALTALDMLRRELNNYVFRFL